MGLRVETFDSAETALQELPADAPSCLVLDDHARREPEKELTKLQRRFDLLTAREREVITLVSPGKLNKQIADQLGTAENTIKVHSSRAMEKLRAHSLADSVRMIEKLKDVSHAE